MAITSGNFTPRAGFVNKQGCLPDPTELVCVGIPKVFDQCLIKRCLKFKEGPDTPYTDEELRSTPLTRPEVFLGCRDFNITLLSINKIPIIDKPNFKKVIINFMISFYADFLDCCGNQRSELFEINRTEIIPNFYCPDPISKTSSTTINTYNNCDTEIIKLEMIADCLDGTFYKYCDNCDVLDITLGLHLIVKCELMVQLLIPSYGYSPVPKLCEEEISEDPYKIFNKSPIPKFYPDEKLEYLFPENSNITHNTDDNNEF